MKTNFHFATGTVFFSITHGDCQLAASVTVIFPQHDQIYALTLQQMRKNANRLFWVSKRMLRRSVDGQNFEKKKKKKKVRSRILLSKQA